MPKIIQILVYHDGFKVFDPFLQAPVFFFQAIYFLDQGIYLNVILFSFDAKFLNLQDKVENGKGQGSG